MASGKTAVASMVASYELSTNENYVVYISPLRSISDEVRDEWKNHKLFEYYLCNDLDNICDNKLFIMTIERLDILLRGDSGFGNKIGCLIVDEAHTLGNESRGHHLESVLMNLTKKSRVVLLSGTMGNYKELAVWIKSLNGKPTNFYHSDWRPVDVEKKVIFFKNDKDKYNQLLNMLLDDPYDKKVIFVYSKWGGNLLKKSLMSDGVYCEFLSADVSKNKKDGIIREFKNRNLNCLISTSLLGAGVSL